MSTKFLPIRLSRPRVTFLAALLLLASADLGWGWHRHKTRAWNRCGVPAEYEYQTFRTNPPVRAVSATAVLLRTAPPQVVVPKATATTDPALAPIPISPAGIAPPLPATTNTVAGANSKPAISYYQLSQAQILSGHCSIARVAMVLQQDGNWRISLQADQNPKQADGTPVPLPVTAQRQPQQQTSHIRRNEFHVVVRGYAAYPLQDAANSTTLGKPLMFRIEVPPFWVQNGIPRDLAWDGYSDDIKDYFDLVDRVEVDLSYR